MSDKQKFEKKLTQSEIQIEIEKVKDFFEQIPDELKAKAAEHFILEIVIWGTYTYHQALGIFEEAKQRYREVSIQVLAEKEEKEAQIEAAYEAAVDYRCVKEIDFGGKKVVVGKVCKIGFAGEDDGYDGGRKYFVFQEDKGCFDICQHCLETNFEPIEGTIL